MYKKYTQEIKDQVIKRWKEKESRTQISSTMNIPRSTIYRWINNYRKENNISKKIINKTIEQLEKRIIKLETMLVIINEVGVSPTAPLKEKLKVIAPLYGKYNVHWLCEAMHVDRGTFYNYIFRGKHGDTFHSQQKKILKEAIQKIYDENRQIYGATKITAILKLQGYHTCENTVSMLMREMKIGSIRQQAKAIYEIDKRLELKNRLNQQFQVTGPNQVWVSDVTCFKILNKTYFICAILDLYARKIVAYRVSSNNSTHLIKQTMQDAYEVRQPKETLMFHSDRGSNYCSKAFSEYLDSLEIIERSFSRKGTPYDNAVIESFFSTLKREELYRMKYRSEKDFLSSLDDYILFYNTRRPHSNNNYKTPDAKEEEYFCQKETSCSD